MTMIRKTAFACATAFAAVLSAFGEEMIFDGTHGYMPDSYCEPKEPEVREHLEWLRDQKLALMVHFGLYTQLGVVESWPLVDSEAPWSRLLVDWADGDDLKRTYWSMNQSFNPVRFQPEAWADAAARNGFRYLIFTTKHHDGFCLYDSKYTDYKVTSPECPFSKHPNADIVRSLYDAFRARGLGISCYFSKPDWHHPDYWDNGGVGDKTTRWPSYDVRQDPARWERFREYTRNQILEIVRNYGKIDVLWLDGGQVQRRSGLDIRIEEIVAEARKIQPWLIAADRTAGGTCENVITPEQTVPPRPLAVPWESCITMGTGFSYRYDDTYKPVRELIHLLVEVVAKGGNLALNVAPGPDGRLPRPAVERMDAMGAWLRKNGEAIYGTRAARPYCVKGFGGTTCFTGRGGRVYAIRLWSEGQFGVRKIHLPVEHPGSVKSVVHLTTGRDLPFRATEDAVAVDIPSDLALDAYADAFAVSR